MLWPCAPFTCPACSQMFFSKKPSIYVWHRCFIATLNHPLSEAVFVELMNTATRAEEVSFNDMYTQVDGVAMGSPLGPPLANIFVGFHEKRVFHERNINIRFMVYYWYVDDTFAIFNTPTACTDFLVRPNALHPALKFTCASEQSNVLPFLDSLVEKTEDGFLTIIYRKATFTG